MELRDGWLTFVVPPGVSLHALMRTEGDATLLKRRHAMLRTGHVAIRSTHSGTVGFYPQDWYMGLPFLETVVPPGYYRLLAVPAQETRGKAPSQVKRLLPPQTELPLAALCAYAFFQVFRKWEVKLWSLEYVWCADCDPNGDQIYVGGYELGTTPGFQIHRHLKLRACHAAVPVEKLSA